MCRFLLVKSKEKIKPERLLSKFALMCKKSKDPGGDWQGDGWGIAVGNQELRTKNQEQKWELYRSLKPIWEEKEKIGEFPETNIFVAHARNAGFPQHRGVIDYNQPYISSDVIPGLTRNPRPLVFVFNGQIKGVKLNRKVEGKIGAQKIFSLIQDVIPSKRSESRDPPQIKDALRTVDQLITNNSKKVIGMNIGVVKDNKFCVLCEYENNPDYFAIRYFQDDDLTLVCSEPIGNYKWKMMKKGEILIL